MSSARATLPYVDEHHLFVEAPAEVVWTALRSFGSAELGIGPGNPLAYVLGTRPRSGFEVAAEDPGRELTMAGRHLFSRYQLVFGLEAAEGGTVVTARTFAAFPGIHGRIYRILVIGSRAHVVATRRILRAVRRKALDMQDLSRDHQP
jgi:hypothetical protein